MYQWIYSIYIVPLVQSSPVASAWWGPRLAGVTHTILPGQWPVRVRGPFIPSGSLYHCRGGTKEHVTNSECPPRVMTTRLWWQQRLDFIQNIVCNTFIFIFLCCFSYEGKSLIYTLDNRTLVWWRLMFAVSHDCTVTKKIPASGEWKWIIWICFGININIEPTAVVSQ